ncbi:MULTISPECIES: GH25 family lysozyme [unclassified Pseudarthrobacter]|uniref:lysozyme n=1 Tax=unclassified Pseudarthrobacter TaxID=2647000 RepID=UPI0036335E71
MKRNPSQSRRPAVKSLWVMLLAASLMASPGITGVALAVEPAPSPTASAAPQASAPTTQPDPAAPSPGGAAPAPQEPTAATEPPAPTPSPEAQQSMAEAVGIGGAEMGQRSARVVRTAPSESVRKLSSEALASEGTWMPTFGVQGLDVSGHQPTVDWRQQWNMGSRFAYVKATEGNYYTNPSYSSQYQGARNVGMIRGAYHFAIPNWSSGGDQARYFVQNGGGWSSDGYTMPPVLDFEFNPYEGRTINGFYFGNTCYNMSAAQLQSWIRDFGNTMRSLTGRLPVIYTNTSWWNQCVGNPAGFGDYPLWMAAYPSSATNNAGPVPTGSWSTYSIWQYSSTGPFAGDSNVWNGDYASLRTFAGAAAPDGSFDDLSVQRVGSTTQLNVRGWAVDFANSSASTQAHVYVTGPDGVRTGYALPANISRPDVNAALGVTGQHGFQQGIQLQKSGTYRVCAYAIGAFSNTEIGCKSIDAKGVESPMGSIDDAREVRSADKVTLSLRGWAIDGANPATATEAHAYLTAPDGTRTGYVMPANLSRPDVDQALGMGANHGYQRDIPITAPGSYKLCVYAIGQYSNPEIGCRQLNFAPAAAPIGSFDDASLIKTSTTAALSVRGWAVDRGDSTRSISVHVYVTSPDGTTKSYPFSAAQARADVNNALGVTGNHGFAAAIPITAPGQYKVCTYAIALSPLAPGNPLLSCRTVDVGAVAPPIGSLDSMTVNKTSTSASLSLAGWAVDKADASRSIDVHIYVTAPDGNTKGYAFNASRPRTDVNTAFGVTGDHGFAPSIPITSPGVYTACAYAIAPSPLASNNPLIGCRTADAGKSGVPVGVLDSVAIKTTAGVTSLEATGWTYDPDMPTLSNPVHAYVTGPDGKTTGYVFSTTVDRPDANKAFGITGTHGYSVNVKTTVRGTYTLCTYGIGVSPFTTGNTALGCRTLTY